MTADISGQGPPPAAAAAAVVDDRAMEVIELEDNEEDDTPTPVVLNKIWECKKIKEITTKQGKNAWICLWCH